MRQSDLPNGWRAGLKKPTIWHFAHRAGYKTVYIDAWGYPLGHSELSPTEEALIDSRIAISETPDYRRDQKLAVELLHVMKEEGPAFIYMSKYGAHLPYSTKYPSNFHVSPLDPGSGTSNHQDAIVWSVNIDAFLRSFLPPFDHEIAHYPNAIAWSVDEFFRTVLPGVDLTKTLIVYTSDHGQSLLPGHFSHCSSTAPIPPGQAYVPLFALTSEPEFKRRLEKRAVPGFGQVSHFEVFPTLLLAMGYDAGWVNRTYGASLMDSPAPHRRFMVGSPVFQPMMVPVDPSSSIETRQVPAANVN